MWGAQGWMVREQDPAQELQSERRPLFLEDRAPRLHQVTGWAEETPHALTSCRTNLPQPLALVDTEAQIAH